MLEVAEVLIDFWQLTSMLLKIQGFFDIPRPFDAAPLIADFSFLLLIVLVYRRWCCCCSPDYGGGLPARKLLIVWKKTPIAIIDKRRSVDKMNTSEVAWQYYYNVEGKTCILIDDMIDTAGTICHAADALSEAGATHVYASCTLTPVLSGPSATLTIFKNLLLYLGSH